MTTDYEREQVDREAATIAAGFNYELSRLSPDELAKADPARVKQYELGIISGGELDALTRHGCFPWKHAKV